MKFTMTSHRAQIEVIKEEVIGQEVDSSKSE